MAVIKYTIENEEYEPQDMAKVLDLQIAVMEKQSQAQQLALGIFLAVVVIIGVSKTVYDSYTL